MPTPSGPSSFDTARPIRSARPRASSRAPAGEPRIAPITVSRRVDMARFCAATQRRATSQPRPASARAAPARQRMAASSSVAGGRIQPGAMTRSGRGSCSGTTRRRKGRAAASSRGRVATRSRRQSSASAQRGMPRPSTRASARTCWRRAARQVRRIGSDSMPLRHRRASTPGPAEQARMRRFVQAHSRRRTAGKARQRTSRRRPPCAVPRQAPTLTARPPSDVSSYSSCVPAPALARLPVRGVGWLRMERRALFGPHSGFFAKWEERPARCRTRCQIFPSRPIW
ncbi:hypothetical protein IFDJLNFL_5359 [Methylobacterium dankookense]|nr:hypothetical protein IFDJLNFL_5359 [Methylobacterium dankookense]